MTLAITVLALVALLLLSGFLQGAAKRASPSAPAVARPNRTPAPTHWPGKAEFDFHIAGVMHHQDTLRKIAGTHDEREGAHVECVAQLVPEPDNPHDGNAIRVDVDGMCIGYLSRDDAPRFRRRLGQKGLTGVTTTCDAIIVGGYVKRGQHTNYGVRLDIKPFL